MKLVYVVNEASFFLSHRLPLAREAQARGFDVVVACGEGTGEARLSAEGISCRPFPLSRSGFNPLEEMRSFRALWRIYRQEKPDLVHHVTIKPVIYGTSAARWCGVPAVVNAIPGLGFVFIRRGQVARLRRMFVYLMYRLALSHPNMQVIFQNSDDMQNFIDSGVTGLLVPIRSHEELASAMVRLGTDAELRQRLGRAAREKAEAVFSVEDVVRHTFLVYDQLGAS